MKKMKVYFKFFFIQFISHSFIKLDLIMITKTKSQINTIFFKYIIKLIYMFSFVLFVCLFYDYIL